MARPNPIKFVGCCAAHCATCRPLIKGACNGCRLGYDTNERDISKSKCRIKICCLKEKKLETCADCKDYPACKTLHGFYSKNGYKYKKYKESMEYIRENGYAGFVQLAKNWTAAYGKLK